MKYLGTITHNKDLVTKEYVDSADATKQDTLVSGTNIKTVNNQSLLGSGNISISGGGGISNAFAVVFPSDGDPLIATGEDAFALEGGEGIAVVGDESSNLLTVSSTAADYVTEYTGESDGWTRRKWKHGDIELWHYHNFGSKTGTAWGSTYYVDVNCSIPEGLLINGYDRLIVNATSANKSWGIYGVSVSGRTMSIRAIRHASNAATLEIYFYIFQKYTPQPHTGGGND